jgi:hypothetical protein
VNARDKKRVGDREVFPFGLAPPFACDFLRCIAASDEDLRSLRTHDVQPFVRPGFETTEITLIPQLRHAALQGLPGAVRERCEMIEGCNAELVDELHDFRIPLGELEAHTVLHGRAVLGFYHPMQKAKRSAIHMGSNCRFRQLPECLPLLAGFCFGCTLSLTARQLSAINTRAA